MKFLFLFIVILLSACSRTIIKQSSVIADGKYDSSFPTQEITPLLNRVLSSVKLVSANTFYEIHYFEQKDHITTENYVLNKKPKPEIINKIGTGAATVISANGQRAMLITCAHIVDPPDTVFTWHFDRFGKKLPYLASIAIKTRKSISIPDMPQVNGYKIIKSDREKDLSLLGIDFNDFVKKKIPVFDIPAGDATELDWGSFVYLIAIPRNLQMVTRALVSNPRLSETSDFLLDSNLQKGVSGGIVFALRDGVANPEFVGITDAIASKSQTFLVPARDSIQTNINRPQLYHGAIFAEQKQSTFYGMVHAISINTILEFIEGSEPDIKEGNFTAPLFINQ